MEVKERIIKGAEQLFLQAGLRNVTMDDIARHLAVSKKTIYQYYKDKNDIIKELIVKRLTEDECDMREVLETSGNVFEKMILMTAKSSEIMANINPITFSELQRFYPEAWKLFEDFMQNILIRQFEQILEKGKEQGYVRKNMDTAIISRLHMNEVFLAFDQNVFPTREFNLKALHDSFYDHFLYGICTLKGHRLLNEYKQIAETDC